MSQKINEKAMIRPIQCCKCGRDLTGSTPTVINNFYFCESCARKEREAKIREMFKKPQIRHTSGDVRVVGAPVEKEQTRVVIRHVAAPPIPEPYTEEDLRDNPVLREKVLGKPHRRFTPGTLKIR